MLEEGLNLDVHHLIPRFLAGTDDLSNLISLCDSCHAARHPNLQFSLARRIIRLWGLRLARLLDMQGELPENLHAIEGALHLLGRKNLRDGQLDAIIAALRGESILVVRPTGFGKSLCFQLPALISPRGALVLSPLKALMQDQIADLLLRKVPATFINSDLSCSEKNERLRFWENSGLKLLYCAPERFNIEIISNPHEIDILARGKPSFLVVDEAHCADRWGRDFRRDYGRIYQIRERLGNPPVLAFTATASPITQNRILESLGIPDSKRLLADIDRPNIALIRLRDTPDDMMERAKIVDSLLRQVNQGHSLIFVPTKKIGEIVKRVFSELGQNYPFYHGNLPYLKREGIIGRFTGRIKPPLKTIICTNAFGMGIDVPDIRVVVHWQHPASIEDYLQELGRAGRDGKSSIALLFMTENDKDLLKYMAKCTVESANLPPDESEEALKIRLDEIDHMGKIAHANGCFRQQILLSMGFEIKRRRRSIARWLVDLLLVKENIVKRSGGCCDECDPTLTKSIQECEIVTWQNTHYFQLVPKLHLGTKMMAKLSLAVIKAFPSSAWERENKSSE